MKKKQKTKLVYDIYRYGKEYALMHTSILEPELVIHVQLLFVSLL